MKPRILLAAVAAILATSACNAEKNEGSSGPAGTTAEAVKPPPGGDWTQVVSATPEGGFRMGNPDAAVKLVEYGSMTCPHCAEFAEAATKPLVDNYVKSGRVSFEFRNYVRDGLDITMSLLTRCGGPSRFFPMTDAMFKSQREFFEKVQASSPAQQQSLSQLPPAQQFAGYAELAGLQSWAAQRGLPSARQKQCLSNQAEIEKLVQMAGDTTTEHPTFPGTPSFTINGELVEKAAAWELLEPKLRDALGG